jgi:hypothetical protein
MATDRASGVIRSLRRAWTPYRPFQDIYRDRQNATLRTTILDTGFGVDLISVDPNCQGGPCVPPVRTPIEVLGRYYFSSEDAGSIETGFAMPGLGGGNDYEYHRFYRLFADPDARTPTGEIDWNGTSMYITGMSQNSLLVDLDLPFHETLVITLSDNRAFGTGDFRDYRGSDNRQSIIAQSDRIGFGSLATPFVNFLRNDYLVLNSCGTWANATNVIVTASDRPFAPMGEYVVYIWRGYGGERPTNPTVNVPVPDGFLFGGGA